MYEIKSTLLNIIIPNNSSNAFYSLFFHFLPLSLITSPSLHPLAAAFPSSAHTPVPGASRERKGMGKNGFMKACMKGGIVVGCYACNACFGSGGRLRRIVGRIVVAGEGLG